MIGAVRGSPAVDEQGEQSDEVARRAGPRRAASRRAGQTPYSHDQHDHAPRPGERPRSGGSANALGGAVDSQRHGPPTSARAEGGADHAVGESADQARGCSANGCVTCACSRRGRPPSTSSPRRSRPASSAGAIWTQPRANGPPVREVRERDEHHDRHDQEALRRRAARRDGAPRWPAARRSCGRAGSGPAAADGHEERRWRNTWFSAAVHHIIAGTVIGEIRYSASGSEDRPTGRRTV